MKTAGLRTAGRPGLALEQAQDLERLARDLDALERKGGGDLRVMYREAELLALADAEDPGARVRRLYPLRVEGPEEHPRADDLSERLTAAALRLGARVRLSIALGAPLTWPPGCCALRWGSPWA